MTNTYTWIHGSHTTRSVANVPSNIGPQTVANAVDRVTFSCTADDGAGHEGTFTDSIILGDPASVSTAITSSSSTDDILAAAKLAIGIGGIARWQALADAALAASVA